MRGLALSPRQRSLRCVGVSMHVLPLTCHSSATGVRPRACFTLIPALAAAALCVRLTAWTGPPSFRYTLKRDPPAQ